MDKFYENFALLHRKTFQPLNSKEMSDCGISVFYCYKDIIAN